MSAPALLQERFWRLPKSMQGFVITCILCIAFSTANALAQFGFVKYRLNQVFLQPYPPRDWVVYAFIGLRTAFTSTLLAWALFRQSLLARILIAGGLIGWIFGTPIALKIVLAGNWRGLPFLLAAVSSIASVVLMLRPESRRWFTRSGRSLADDVEDFD